MMTGLIPPSKGQEASGAFTLSDGVAESRNPTTLSTAGFEMSAPTIRTVPLVIMVLVFQRRIVEGLTAGAGK